MAKDTPEQVTCPKCEKDIPKDKMEDGRCPECGYPIGFDSAMRQYESVRDKERKKEPPVNEPKKKSGLTGLGF